MAKRRRRRRRIAVGEVGPIAKAGVTVLYLGDHLKAVYDGDRVQMIGTVGLAFAY
jgi:hypothetical protein